MPNDIIKTNKINCMFVSHINELLCKFGLGKTTLFVLWFMFATRKYVEILRSKKTNFWSKNMI